MHRPAQQPDPEEGAAQALPPAAPGGPGLRSPRSPAELFKVFNRLALQGFGGVLPVAQRELVERERWLTQQQFLDLLATSQVLPGPNIVNLSLMLGDRWFGWRGALAALAGMLAVPLLIVLLLAALHARFALQPAVAGAVRGMGAVAAGLVIATAIRLARPLRGSVLGPAWCAGLALAALAAVAWLRWPLPGVALVLGGAGCALAWRRLARRSS